MMRKLRTFAANCYSPEWWTESAIPFLRYRTTLAVRGLSRYWYTPTDRECRFIEEDWDNSIILDACRFDQFERLNTVAGNLQSLTSRGSSTPEFLSNNFTNPPYYDTVYITANPQYRKKNLGGVFHDVIDVWDFGWDEELRTVPPSNVASAAKNAATGYPNKRLIVHFMQPHYPFIGPGAEEIGNHGTFNKGRRAALGREATRDYETVWEKLRKGKLSERTVERAYDGNLEVALPYVDDLVDTLTGKTVVSSDHGNLLGERVPPFRKRLYGHPTNVYAEAVRKVPWLLIEDGSRKDVQSDPPQEMTEKETETVSKRLADLGYR